MKIKYLLEQYFWLFCSIIGSMGFIHVFFYLPTTQKIDAIWQFYYKLFIYTIICLGIASFPNNKKWYYLLVIPIFFIFLGFIIPRLGYLGFVALPQKDALAFKEYYKLLFLILYPAITLSISFAYRIGGGNFANTFKIALGSQIILLSGYLDILWHIINQVEFPSRLTNAHHIKIIIGHFPTVPEAIVFSLFHIPILLLLLILPINKWRKVILKKKVII